jgi:hypothetical protein
MPKVAAAAWEMVDGVEPVGVLTALVLLAPPVAMELDPIDPMLEVPLPDMVLLAAAGSMVAS